MSRRLQNLYVVEVVMQAGYAMDASMAYDIARKLSGYPDSTTTKGVIDEYEDNLLNLSFRSSYLPQEMIRRADELMASYKYLGVYYIDLKYAYPYDLNADRVVIWADGRRQEYYGKIEWTEENADGRES